MKSKCSAAEAVKKSHGDFFDKLRVRSVRRNTPHSFFVFSGAKYKSFAALVLAANFSQLRIILP